MSKFLFNVCFVWLTLLVLPAAPAIAITVDGRLDEGEWLRAQRLGELVTVSPLTRQTPRFETEVLVHSDERGIYFGVRAEQPAGEPRTRHRTARDAQARADRVNLIVDLDGRGVAAYEFTLTISGGIQDAIVTNQRNFSYDWDGLWYYAVHEEPHFWSAELHLPWSIAPMGEIVDGRRTIGVYASRVLESRGERYSHPGYDFEHPTFVADMARVEIAAWNRASFDLLPYLSFDHDRLRRRDDLRAGLDLFWRPDGRHQLALALRPDFGQVESDDLVVDYSAIETFFSEKRPLFTDNQSLFWLPTSNGGQLVHTRRIGARPDRGPEGATDIDLALKYTGTGTRGDWGVLLASEDDSSGARGRDYGVLRGRWRGSRGGVGYVGTYARRPSLDREAQVHGFDGEWYPGSGFSVRGQAIHTRIDQRALVGDDGDSLDRRGFGAWLRADYAPGPRLLQRLEISRYDRDYQINDLGYMRRNDYDELFSSTTWYRRSYPARSPLQSSFWRLEALGRRNLDGDRVHAGAYLGRVLRFQNTSNLEVWLGTRAPFVDDLITRGHGSVRLPGRREATVYAQSPRWRALRVAGRLRYQEEGVRDGAWEAMIEPTLYLSEDFTTSLRLTRLNSRDWLIWRGGKRLASYRRDQVSAYWDLNWFPAARHELRGRAQFIGLSAQARRSFRADGGRLVEVEADDSDFSVGTLAVQLRYRYEFAPLSELYLVYSRGGLGELDDERTGFGDLFDLTRARVSADQVLAKLRWRF